MLIIYYKLGTHCLKKNYLIFNWKSTEQRENFIEGRIPVLVNSIVIIYKQYTYNVDTIYAWILEDRQN